MATLQTTTSGNGTTSRKVGPPTPATQAKNSLSAADGSTSQDLAQGCAAGATITGPARVRTTGRDVVVCGLSTAAGVLAVETSSDGGSTWVNSDSDAVLASEYVTSRTTTVTNATHYRVKFTAGAVAASKVEFHSQCRP